MGEIKKIGSRAEVWHRTAQQTSGGLKRKDLQRVKKGDKYRIVSKKQNALGKKNVKSQKARKKWTDSIKKARSALIKEKIIEKGEFVPILKRKSTKYNQKVNKKGKELYKRARSIYDSKK